MDISTMYLLLFLAALLFVISLFCAVTGRENIITIMCMLFSGIICWAMSNTYISGTLTKVNPVTGVADIIQDGTASSVLMLIGLLAMFGFVLQVWQAFSSSGVVEAFDE
jgi:Na+/phosphate symporter